MKKYLAIILTIIALGAIGFFYVNSTKVTDEKMMENTLPKTDDVMMKDTNLSYVFYSEDTLKNTIKNKRVLFFYANWCPTCRPVNEEFTANIDKIPTGVSVIRVNYNDTDTDKTEEALANKYGITYQHTFVQIDENGDEIAKWNGGGISELIQNLK